MMLSATATIAIANADAQVTERAPAQADAVTETTPAAPDDASTDIVVTGFRQSLENAARDKRSRTNFTDSIFAEDIGKFPDVNLAESLQRLPGIQIERDVNNEGARINVRGLGPQFSLVSLNNAQIQSVSETSGASSEGRGISLDLFPTELFRSLTLSKSATAGQLEGAIAGNVDLRPVRPFDRDGFNLNWQTKATYQDVSDRVSPRGSIFASNTWNTGIGKVGLLGGFAFVRNQYRTDLFHTVGHTSLNLQTRCPPTQGGCNSQSFAGNASNPTYGYGGGATIPGFVPANTGLGLTSGAPLNPCGPGGTSGLSCNALSYAILPRLARSEVQVGNRTRLTGLVTGQWAPDADLTFNFDAMYSHAKMYYSQNDLMMMVRSTNNLVPVNFAVNDANLLTQGTFGNVQMLSENRRVYTNSDFGYYSIGFDYNVTDLLRIRGSAAYNTSSFDQRAWTFLLRTAPNIGLAVDYNHPEGAIAPTMTLNRNVNDPNLGWVWDTLRVQPQFRDAKQRDFQLHGEYGTEALKVTAGIQLPKFERRIVNWDTSNCATNGVAGQPCPGTTIVTDRNGAIASVPNSQLNGYMVPFSSKPLYRRSGFDVGLNAWALPDYDRLEAAIDIPYFERELDPVNHLSTINPRAITERTHSAYVQVDGNQDLRGHGVRYNLGMRYISTRQGVSGIVSDPTLGRDVQFFGNTYSDWLPSGNLAVDVTDRLVLRLAASRTITRPNPGDLAPGFSLSVSGDSLSIGNPELRPFYADGADIGLEWYLARNNTIAINLWQKNVEGFTDIVRSVQPFGTLGVNFANLPAATQQGLTNAGNGNPNNAPVNISQRQNTTEIVTLRGIEISLLQPLDILVEGLGFTANYTYIKQTTNAPDRILGTRLRKPPVTSVSPSTVNVSAYYENHGISARVSYNYRDPYVVSFGPVNNVEGDSIMEKSSFLDASIGIELPFYRAARLTLEAQNLTNQAQIVNIDGQRQMPVSVTAPGRTFSIGLAGSF
ncbi:TonB-dependent receptor [Sphingomonas sp. CFBP 8760]|uniref:TonB-dependent receptor n=1 Tax=Sphingomonas sp. CFBP 8760 TaxID=2775282 RepID=UPI001783530E|nr:TonB-dependent receptor [Sphingomonas sp. CFBP 8760]MBD8548564.1 TonB-dependent receptor [Sphingomonas sp. CFBP 8760]